MMRARIIIADDHRIVAEGIRGLLDSDYDLVGIAEDGRSLVTMAEKLHPDVIIVDVTMPQLNGIEACRQIKKNDERIMIVFLTMHPDITYAAAAFDSGASGYLLKYSASSELNIAIRSVLEGKTYITPMLAGELMSFYKKRRLNRHQFTHQLTGRQKEVLQLLAEGRTTKEIASLLNISTRTVEFHKYRMMQEYGLKNSAELIHFAIKNGIIVLL